MSEEVIATKRGSESEARVPTIPSVEGPRSARLVFAEVRERQGRRRLAFGLGALLAYGSVALGVMVSGGAPSAASPLMSVSNTGAKPGSVSLVQPTSIALVDGNLYIADPGRQEILKRSPNGGLSVVAGTGIPGFSGDGGPATRAKIDDPADLVALKSGSVFFEQAGPRQGSLIREITPSGVIRTVAGLHPSCAGVAVNATSIAAESAMLKDNPLSVGGDGLLLVAIAQPCPLAHQLGPFLQLSATGKLVDTQLDSSPLIHSTLVNCGASASGAGFRAFLCLSGAGHPKELLVLRKDDTTRAYPTFGGGAIASARRQVVAVRDNAVVRVMSHGLETVASGPALKRLVRYPNVPSIIGLAVSGSGMIFVTTDQVGAKGCTATMSEISSSGRVHVLWDRFSRACY
jgi:hypothetical protein